MVCYHNYKTIANIVVQTLQKMETTFVRIKIGLPKAQKQD